MMIYSPEVTPRINYIFQLFFDSLIKTPFSITTDEGTFKAHNGPKINYSLTSFSNDEIHIIPSGLLSETDIKPQSIGVTEWNKTKIFFKNVGTIYESSLPFDIFSASFYLVTRYEEYLSYKPDEHKRFHHTKSLAFKNNFLDEPLINIWAEELKKLLVAKYPDITFSQNKYSLVPTIDIDIAYSHLGRSVAITMGSFLKALSKFDFRTLIEKKLVLLHLKKDPYDTYHYQEDIFKKYKLRPIYFILAGERGKHDKNISPENSMFKKLVKKLSSFAKIGIHPSYQSESLPEIVEKEIKSIEINITQKITSSRQHFLRLKLPETYLCLAKLGITDDYSMAYPGAPGFRASICTPFNFYDLKVETELPVKIHSCALMDGTFTDYMKIPATEAEIIALNLVKKVREYNGEFIFIWHNHTFSEQGRWKGLNRVFENILKAGIG